MSLQLKFVTAGLAKVTPDIWRLKECNPFAKFYWPFEGEGEIGIGHTRVNIRPGGIYYIPPWVPLEMNCERDFKHAWVHFYIVAGQGVRGELQDKILQFAPEDPAFMETCFLQFSQWKERYSEESRRTQMSGCLYAIMGDFMRAFPKLFLEKTNDHPLLKESLTYIHEHLGEELSSEQLALRTSWSRVYFSQLFSQTYGIGPKEYIIQRRLSEARRLLCDSSRSIREVAEDVGLNDAYYFSRLFKQRHGVSPRDFRRAASAGGKS